MTRPRTPSRRHVVSTLLGAASRITFPLAAAAPVAARATPTANSALRDRVLLLIELRGGNDGLNTVVPYADPTYRQLRPTLGLSGDQVLRLNDQVGLHPELSALMPLWTQQELAIVQGVGYPTPNLSHFRSIEIWDTASDAHEYLADGWLSRATRLRQQQQAGGAAAVCDGVRVGVADLGPLAGANVVVLNDPQSFAAQAGMATGMRAAPPNPIAPGATGNRALQHILKVQADTQRAALGLRGDPFVFNTRFPGGPFGRQVQTALQILASQRGQAGVPVVILSLGSFDTHQNQSGPHGDLLRALAEGVAALRSGLLELQMWEQTLVMTYSEFGRRPRQNQSNGTDHGTAAPLLLAGGAVRGGLLGAAPDLAQLDATQNLVHTVDFRQVYASVAQQWWGLDARQVVRGNFSMLPIVR